MSKAGKNTEKYHKKWYKLDLSANVYPTLQRKDFSSVFRLSVTLTEPVDPVLLEQAFHLTIPRFPTFASAIRAGLFWRYLEPNPRPLPPVREDISNPCMPMPFKSNNRYLIRLYYFENTISLEAFHSLTDGTGGMYFLRTLTAVYLRLKGHDIPCGHGVLDIHQEPDPEELEDSYMRYARSRFRSKRSQEQAYRPLKLAMPVNLRRFFPSKTMRNFISMVYPSIDPRMGDYTFEDIITQVHHYMRYYLNNKFLNADITTNAATQRHPVIRTVPLFIKDLFVRQFYIRIQDKQSSAGLTNLGVIDVPPEMAPFVDHFEAIMGQPFSARTNCAIASFQDALVINFASSIVETDIERLFFCKLVEDQVPVTIRSNRSMEV